MSLSFSNDEPGFLREGLRLASLIDLFNMLIDKLAPFERNGLHRLNGPNLCSSFYVNGEVIYMDEHSFFYYLRYLEFKNFAIATLLDIAHIIIHPLTLCRV
ncbi:MAG: hypothetical protein ACU84J_15080 [Gammaproteobacteria bacterium]